MLLETLCNTPAKPQKWVWKGVIPRVATEIADGSRVSKRKREQEP